MSKEVDERVVSMQFDNKQFESGVSTSMSTIDKLKKKLDFTGAEKGLENVSTAARKVNMNGLSGAIETVQAKFSAMQVVAITALSNITNSAVNAGKRLISAFTIDPVKTGFQEYETQINAVQTILANTQSKGTTLDQVNAALDTLNTYADKTIYNFTEMTKNIGTFTAAGIDLDTSVNAIQGIANLAAISGSTSQQASTAMYQLSQALAAGTVKLMDWNSVVNAGMGGQVFQDALKETARVHGIAIDKMIKDEGSFRETLKSGWITSEILTETLQKFTLTTDDLTQAQIKQNREMLKNKGYTDAQIDAIFKLGKTATDAATKVKTFTQLMDTLKEAAQSGWTQTWEIIIGDFEDAKSLWTDASNFFGDMIQKSADARNSIVSEAFTSKWEQFSEKIEKAGISTEIFQKRLIDTAKKHGIAVDEIIEKTGSFEKSLGSGWLTSNIVIETLKDFVNGASMVSSSTGEMTDKLKDFQKIVNQVIRGDFGNGKARIEGLSKAGYDYATIQGMVNTVLKGGKINIDDLSDSQLKNIGYTEEQIKALKELAKEASETGTPINELIENLSMPSGRELLIDSFKNTLHGLMSVIYSVKSAWTDIFPTDSSKIYNLIKSIHKLSLNFITIENNADNLKRTFKGLFAVLDIVKTVSGGALRLALEVLKIVIGDLNLNVLDVTARIGDALVAARNWLKNNEIINGSIKFLANIVIAAKDSIVKLIEKIKEVPFVTTMVNKLSEAFNYLTSSTQWVNDVMEFLSRTFGKAKSKVKEWIDVFKAIPGVSESLKQFKEGISEIVEKLGENFQNGKEVVEGFITRVKELDGLTLNNIQKAFKDFKDNVLGYFFNVGNSTDKVRNSLTGFSTSMANCFNGAGHVAKNAEDGIENFSKKSTENLSKFIEFVKTKLSGVNLGSILAASLGIATIINMTKVSKAIATLTNTIGGPEGIILSIKGFIGSLSTAVTRLEKAEEIEIKSRALLNFAKAIGVLVACIIALALVMNKVDNIDQSMLKAFGMIAGLIVLMSVMMGALTLCTKAVGKGSDGIKNIIPAIKSLASSMILLAIAFGLIAKLSWGQFAVGAASMATMVVIMLGLMASTRALGPLADKCALTIVALAGSMLIMALAFKSMAAIDEESAKRAIGVIAWLSKTLGALMFATKFLNITPSSAAGIMALGGAILLMSVALKLVASFDVNTAAKALLILTILSGVMVGLMAATSLMGREANKSANAIFAAAAGILMLSVAMKMVASLSASDILKGAAAIVILAGVVSGLMMVISLLGKDAPKMAGTLLAAAAAVMVLAIAVSILSMIDGSALARATAAVAVLTTVVGGLIALSHFASDCKATLITLAVIIGILVASLAVLSMIDQNGLQNATICISAVIAMFALLVASTSLAKNASLTLGILTLAIVSLTGCLMLLSGLPTGAALNAALALSALIAAMSIGLAAMGLAGNLAVTALAGAAVMTLVVLALAIIMKDLCNTPNIDKSIAISEALSILMLSMSAAMLVMAAAGSLASIAVRGIAALMAVIVAIGALMICIGNLMKDVPEMEEFLDKGMDILGKIATGIGEIFGNIVGGLLTSISASLITVGANLSSFALAAKPFLSVMRTVDQDILDGTLRLVGVVLAVTGASLLTGIASFLTGGTSMVSFAAQLVALGYALVAYSNIVKGNIDDEAVETSTKAATMIADFATKLNSIPSLGGIGKFFTGDNSILAFALQLPALGNALANYSNTVSGKINNTSVESSIKAATMIADFATKLNDTPSLGGLGKLFTGDNSILAFARQLPSLGVAMATYSNAVSGNIDNESVESSIKAATMISDFAIKLKDVPSLGGLGKLFTGDNSILAFALQLPSFGMAMVSYSEIVADKINGTAVESSIKAATMISDFAIRLNDIPSYGGLVQAFTGDNSLVGFAAQLVPFGSSMAKYSESVDGKISAAAVESSTKAGAMLVDLAKQLKDIPSYGGISKLFSGDNSISGFALQLSDFGYGISSYSDSIKNVQTYKMSSVTDQLIRLIQFAKDSSSVGINGMTGFSTALTNLANNGISGFINAFDNSETRVRNAANKLISGFVNGLNSNSSLSNNAFKSVVGSGIAALDGEKNKLTTAGKDCIDRILIGIRDKALDLKNSFSTPIAAAISAIRSYNSEFRKAGVYITDGLAAGIRSEQYKVIATAKVMAETAVKSVRRTLDIHSPSKVMYEFGRYFDLGFANGIGAYTSVVSNSGENIAQCAVDGVSYSINKISDLINSGMDTNPTIRPVVDLSDVYAGQKVINGLGNSIGSISSSSNLAYAVSDSMNSRREAFGQVSVNGTTNEAGTTTNNYTFNITGNDPQEIANRVSEILQTQVERRTAVWGQ